jgi:hypothetical protein
MVSVSPLFPPFWFNTIAERRNTDKRVFLLRSLAGRELHDRSASITTGTVTNQYVPVNAQRVSMTLDLGRENSHLCDLPTR